MSSFRFQATALRCETQGVNVLLLRRFHAVLFPITTYICEILEEGSRETSMMDLCYEDLEKLHPDEVARICEWLTEKVDGFSSKVKPEAKDVEEEVGILKSSFKVAGSCLMALSGYN